MKRIVSVLLIVLLFLPVSGYAMANQILKGILSGESEQNSYGSLKEAVSAYLDSLNYQYSYDEERDLFSYKMSINSTLNQCDVGIFMKEDGFSVYAYSPITPRIDNLKQMTDVAEYLTRANYGMNLGGFQMDHRDGEVRYKTSIMCFDRIPSQREIEFLVDIPALMLQRYGDGLARVVLTGADPEEEIALVETDS